MVATFAACGASAMVLRLALTLTERRWPMDEVTLGRARAAAAAQGAWDIAPRLLRGGMEAGGARAGATRLRELLLQCAGAQAWTAAEEIIQVSSASTCRRRLGAWRQAGMDQRPWPLPSSRRLWCLY
jgi:hypothetical protein